MGHFNDFMEDQFDFHAYCVRKMTLRAYVQMLRMEDTIHKNIFYSKVRPPPFSPYLVGSISFGHTLSREGVSSVFQLAHRACK